MADRLPALRAALPMSAVALREQHSGPQDAIRRSGELLAIRGAVEPAYTDEMLAALDAYGPYIVIAPGVALAHSRPSPAVHEVAFSILTLDPAIPFGHADNDPVRLVVGLAAPDDESHIDALRQMAALLSDDGTRERLLAATRPEEVMALVEGEGG